jgi:DNA-binding CsgD family transcriptional regulator/tetratricopeptide (TPR) repeat protein
LLDAELAARLHGLAAHALYALNRFGEASAHAARAAQEWLALGRSPLELGDALLVCSRMHTMVGNPRQARAEIEQALSILEPFGPSPALAHAHGMMGNLDAIEANNTSAAQWCRRAVGEARAVGRSDIEAHARIYLGLARVGLGDLHGFDDLHAAVKLATELDHGDYLCRAALNLATATIWLGRHPEAPPYLDVAEAAAREHGLDHHTFHALVQRCHVDLYVGRWDAAERVLRQQLATERDPAALMIIPLALLGRIQARRGDPEASSLVARAWELATRSRQVHRMALAGAAVIEEAWLRGDSDVVRTTAALLLPIADRANLVYLRGEALRYLRRVGAPFEAGGNCPGGFAAGTAGDWARAATAWAAAGNPYEQALELTESRDPQVAFDGLRRLDSLGAAGTAALVRRELRRRGVGGVPRGPRSATKANPAGLTARQFDVLTLLGQGLTSAEIAERLYLSRRTVENHAAAVLARLGVSTRRRAVEVAVEMGWLPVTAHILSSRDGKDE